MLSFFNLYEAQDYVLYLASSSLYILTEVHICIKEVMNCSVIPLNTRTHLWLSAVHNCLYRTRFTGGIDLTVRTTTVFTRHVNPLYLKMWSPSSK